MKRPTEIEARQLSEANCYAEAEARLLSEARAWLQRVQDGVMDKAAILQASHIANELALLRLGFLVSKTHVSKESQ